MGLKVRKPTRKERKAVLQAHRLRQFEKHNDVENMVDQLRIHDMKQIGPTPDGRYYIGNGIFVDERGWNAFITALKTT